MSFQLALFEENKHKEINNITEAINFFLGISESFEMPNKLSEVTVPIKWLGQ